MTVVNIPRVLRAALPVTKFLRNTNAYPDSMVTTFMQEETNRICRWRLKELASFCNPITGTVASEESSSAEKVRWRFAFRTSSYARTVIAEFLLLTADGVGGDPLPAGNDPYGKLLLSSGDVVEARYGSWVDAVAASDVPSSTRSVRMQIHNSGDEMDLKTVTPNSEYTATISDVNYARTLSCSVYELSLDSDTDNDYLASGVAVGSPIGNRTLMTTMLRNAWKQNGAHLWNWSSNSDAAASESAVPPGNWIDPTHTTPSAASPGVTLDLRFRNRTTATTVPCKWHIYAKNSLGTGTVKLYNADTGAVVGTLSPSTVGWYSTSVSLPATRAKYDIKNGETGDPGITTIYASSLYQYST